MQSTTNTGTSGDPYNSAIFIHRTPHYGEEPVRRRLCPRGQGAIDIGITRLGQRAKWSGLRPFNINMESRRHVERAISNEGPVATASLVSSEFNRETILSGGGGGYWIDAEMDLTAIDIPFDVDSFSLVQHLSACIPIACCQYRATCPNGIYRRGTDKNVY